MKNRDLRISNIKGVLIFLVVFGHAFEPFREYHYSLYTMIYSFHMPLFIFISGLLAKRMTWSKVINLLLLYLIFQTVFNVFLFAIDKYDTIPFHYATPQFHLWYLVSLASWYSISILFLKMKNRIGILYLSAFLLLIVCFVSRWYLNDFLTIGKDYFAGISSFTFSFQRTLTFAPFFFAGFFLSKDMIKQLSTKGSDSLKVGITIALLILMFKFIDFHPKILNAYWGSFGKESFVKSGGVVDYLFLIGWHYVISSIICVIFISLATNKWSLFTKWGDNSLQIFLFHPVITYILWDIPFIQGMDPNIRLISLLLVSIIICFILGSKVFVRLTGYICNPYATIQRLLKAPKESDKQVSH